MAPNYEVGEAPNQLSKLLYIPIHTMDTPHIRTATLLSMSVHMAIRIAHHVILYLSFRASEVYNT